MDDQLAGRAKLAELDVLGERLGTEADAVFGYLDVKVRDGAVPEGVALELGRRLNVLVATLKEIAGKAREAARHGTGKAEPRKRRWWQRK